MELLIGWITQIIIFLLLATIIDLLIPANAMRKYVKFVIGLIMILILLKPVFYIFHIDIKQALETSFSQHYQADKNMNNVENQIDLQKREIESVQNAYILEEMAVQLKEMAQTPLSDAYHVEITKIEFNFKPAIEYSYEDLEEVIVYLQELEEEEGVVHAVDEVVIDMKKQVVNEDKEKTDDIIHLLQEVWEFNDKKLTIIWEGGTS